MFNVHRRIRRENQIYRCERTKKQIVQIEDGAVSKLITLKIQCGYNLLLFYEINFRRGQCKHKDLIAPAENGSDQLNFIGNVERGLRSQTMTPRMR